MPLTHKPANTLIILNSAPRVWRAMEEFHHSLCSALSRRGAEIAVVFASRPTADIENQFQSAGAATYCLAYRNRLAFARGIAEVVRRHSIGLAYIRFFRLNQWISWVVRSQGVSSIIYTDAESGESNAKGLRRLLKQVRTRMTTSPTTRVIAISEFVKERLLESGVLAEKIEVIHNGVNLTRFSPDATQRELLARRYRLPSEELILSTISRFHRVKRVDTLLRTCAGLRDVGIPFRFLIAGQGGPLEVDLKRLSQQLGIDDRVYWLGQTSTPEHLLQASDLFLLASVGEAFGNVLVEAMACGVPVIGSRSGAIPEIVVDGESGLLAEPNDAQSFVEKIRDLNDPLTRARFSLAAIKRAEHFSVSRSVEETVKLISSLSPS